MARAKGTLTLIFDLARSGAQISAQGLRLWLIYRAHDHKGDGSFPGEERLAREMGISVTQVKAHRSKLKRDGFLKVKKRGALPALWYAVIPGSEAVTNSSPPSAPLPTPPRAPQRTPRDYENSPRQQQLRAKTISAEDVNNFRTTHPDLVAQYESEVKRDFAENDNPANGPTLLKLKVDMKIREAIESGIHPRRQQPFGAEPNNEAA